MARAEAPPAPSRHPGGRPRDAAAERRILDAALALVVEDGYAATTIERVAARAGVARPTIYRRWRSREAMVVAAVERAFRAANPSAPRSADVRADLVRLLGNTIDLLVATPVGAVIRALVPELERSRELAAAARALERRRRTLLLEVLERAASAGRLRPGLVPAIALELLLGPVYFRLLVSHDALDRSLAEVLVDAVLA